MALVPDIRITDRPFDPEAEIATLRRNSPQTGGLVSFTGLVRSESRRGAVLALELEHYPAMTEADIAGYAQKVTAHWPLAALLAIHRVGRMTPGEPIVLVAAASAHRRAAFKAADCLMDYLKSRALFWKRETTADGSAWIEPVARDYQDADRWSL
ncbi:MAG: molybdenum cofactor biosynthesis protein MoaE [Blastomonas sp.]